MPRVSVVMPAYNAEKYIDEAIESILSQTFSDFEFIIINDGSSDNTKSIIQSFCDNRILYLENECNLGIVDTLNKGLKCATGKYIARMDADDIAMPERIEKQFYYMEHDVSIGVLGTGTRIFGEGIQSRDTHSSLNSDKLKADLLFSTCICHPSVMIRREVLDNYHIKYDPRFKGAEDYKLWWDIVQVSRIGCLPEPLHCYRIHPDQITQVKDEKYKKLLSDMLDVRMNTMNVSLSETEKESFLTYCMGDYQNFTETKMTKYIDLLDRIIKKNKETAFFNQNRLREVCSLSVTYALNNSKLSENTRKKLYEDAISKGIYPIIMRAKLFVHGTFR